MRSSAQSHLRRNLNQKTRQNIQNTNTMSNLSIVEQETAAFELIQRHAKMLSASTLVPKDFQGNMANCAIGLNIAKRLGADPFMVLQNIDIIHGRPSFRATFLIAMVNASGRFSPLQFRMNGEGANRTCVAHCKVKETGEVIEGPEISMAMAKAEGWSTKAGSKWLTMPELMLRYRAAAFFARLYAPDITLGMQTSEENHDIAPEPRMATGRVVTENPMTRLQNTPVYHEPEPSFADLPEAKPEPSGEQPMESPVEVSESAERAELMGDIKAMLIDENTTLAKYAPLCRKVGLLGEGVQLPDAPIDLLRAIHEDRLPILRGEYVPV